MMRPMVMHYGTRGLVLALVGLLGSACGGDDGGPSGADTTEGESTSAGTTTAASNTMSASGMAEVGESLDSTGGGTTGGTTGIGTSMSDGGFLDSATSGDPPPMPQPNGTPCQDAEGCESGFCYQIPMLGGVCSECLVDTDCATGTCSIDPVGYAICTDGSIGVMCSSDEGCMGELVCAEVVDTGGLFPLNFCSECNDSTPCPGDQICTPVYDIANVQGYLACVDPGTVPNGGGCPLEGFMGNGDACQSGLCGVASAFGLIPIGVCGECLSDMDCMAMESCSAPTADRNGLQGAVCM